MLIHQILGQRHAHFGGHRRSLGHQCAAVCPLGCIGCQLANGIAPAGRGHIECTIQHIFFPNSSLHIAAHLTVYPCRIQKVGNFLRGLFSFLAVGMAADIQIGVASLLGNGIVASGAGNRIDHAVHQNALAQALCQLLPGRNAVHHSHHGGVLTHHRRNLLANLLQPAVFYTNENQILHAAQGGVLLYAGGMHGKFAVQIAVQRKAVLPQRFLARAARDQAYAFAVFFHKVGSQHTTNAANTHHHDFFHALFPLCQTGAMIVFAFILTDS